MPRGCRVPPEALRPARLHRLPGLSDRLPARLLLRRVRLGRRALLCRRQARHRQRRHLLSPDRKCHQHPRALRRPPREGRSRLRRGHQHRVLLRPLKACLRPSRPLRGLPSHRRRQPAGRPRPRSHRVQSRLALARPQPARHRRPHRRGRPRPARRRPAGPRAQPGPHPQSGPRARRARSLALRARRPPGSDRHPRRRAA